MLLAAATLSTLVTLYLSRTIGHDQAWYLYAANQMLEGVPLYGSQLTETNPPLILWFSLLPATLARILPITPAVALHLFTLALALASTAWCARLLASARLRTPGLRYLLFLVALLTAACNLIPFDLGQREQLLVIFVLPCLTAIATRVTLSLHVRELAAIGFCAGVGICFKPQQVILLVMVFAGVLASTPLRRVHRAPEWIAVLGAIAAILFYLAGVFLFAPRYVPDMMPLLVNTYWAFGKYTFFSVIKQQHRYPFMLALLTVIFFLGRRRALFSPASGFFLLAATGSWLAYGVQHTGFFYQRIPEDAFFKLALFWMIIELASRWMALLSLVQSLTRLQIATGIIITLCLGAFQLNAARLREQSDTPPPATVQGFFRSLAPGTAVWTLSTDLSAQYPDVLLDHLVWGSRFAHLWMLPAIQQNEAMREGGPVPAKVLSDATLAALEKQQREATDEDMTRWRPQFILVPRCATPADCYGFSRPFDTLRWFQQSHAFATAWSQYRYRGVLPNVHDGVLFDLYELR